MTRKIASIVILMVIVCGVQAQSIKQDIQRQKQQQEERDKAMEAAEIEEMVRRANDRWEVYKESDKYKILESIANDFDRWSQKGEFETTIAYEERLKGQSIEKFYQLCEEKITNFFNGIRISDVELQQYDADSQYFPVEISISSANNSDSFLVAIPVSIGDAPKFKADFRSCNWKKCQVYDLAFVDYTPHQVNPHLVPTKLSYNGIEYSMQIEDSREIEISFKDLSGDNGACNNPYCTDAVWNIKMIRIAEEKRIAEQRRLDSIACIKYNRELDSLVTAYNKELLQNKYNFGKETIKTVKVECGQGIETRFSVAKNNITNNYKTIIAIAEAAKQREQDSLACIDYNKQLDSIAESYNQKLLEEEYNLDKKTIKFLPLEVGVRNGQEIEKWFNEEQNSITKKYNSIMDSSNKNRKIVDDYKRTNYDDLKSFVFKERVSSLPSGHNSYTYYNCPEYIYKGILVSRAYNKYSDELIAKLIEATVDINTQLNDEWTRNGQYFENKVDFFDSFLNYSTGSRTINKNPKYESILKDKIYYKMPEEERQMVDSINCVEYNHKLDSIVSTCNEKLRKEGYYNLKNEKIENVSLKCGKGIEDRFETEKDKVEKNFNTIMKEIDKNKKTIEDYKRINIDNIKSFSFAKFVDNTSDAYGRIITNQKPAYILDVREGDLLNEKLIEFIVDTNKQLNKEWSKDGQYFESKVEFYSIYLKFGYHQVGVNPEYKTILKEKKKTK